MKKSMVILCAMMLLLAANVHAVPFFDILDTTYHIEGFLCSECSSYNQTSNRPIADMVEYDDPLLGYQKAQSIAKAGYLYGEIIDDIGDDASETIIYQSRTEVWSETVFNPLLNGSGPTLSFYFAWEYPHGQFEGIITDNTLGVDIFNIWDVWNNDEDEGVVSFMCDYNDWNIDHNYTLKTSIWGSTNQVGHHQYEMKTDFFEFANVPEPSTILLIGSGLIGLAGLRRKFRKR